MATVLRTRDELAREAERFVAALKPAADRATLVTLSGALGAGKTAFTQEIARALGVEEPVTSPTFVLEKIYQLPPGKPFARLVHIDAYRLESGSELRALGFDELMQDAGNLVLVEWPEHIADALPQAEARITLAADADGTRTLTYL